MVKRRVGVVTVEETCLAGTLLQALRGRSTLVELDTMYLVYQGGA